MRRDKVEIYLHLIWTTWDREAYLTPAIEELVYDLTRAMVERHDGHVVAIGGIEDHVHTLVRVASTTLLCELVKDAKGATSRFATSHNHPFKWRPTYAAFSVSRWDVEMIKGYISHQKEHHARGTTQAMLETSDEEVQFFDGDWVVLESD